jgi:hypothetical protein
MNQLPDEYFDLKSLATYCKMGVSSLRGHIRSNGLPWFRIAGKKDNCGKILVKRSEFDDWMEQYRANDYLDPEAVVDDIIKSLSDK